jgi:rhodanese-related sulfurtransferase
MNLSSVTAVTFIFSFCFTSFSSGQTSLPEGKQTTLGLYVTAKEAYEKWLADPDNVKILDVRTPEEYIFIGHAPMAFNIPLMFITHRFNENRTRPVMEDNPDFPDLAKAKFKTTDTILVMCRSGGRSARSVNKLAEAGFKNVYTITDGFEGDVVKDTESSYYGKRLKNGWKNAGNPWTYDLDPDLVYDSEIKD